MSHLQKATGMRPFEPGRWITVFADASFCHQTKAWGYGFWVKWGDPAQTNIGWGGGAFIKGSLEAETEALREALKWVREHLLPADLAGKNVVVQSDCTGALARMLADFDTFRRATGATRCYGKHVKGHQGHTTPRNSVNTTCDRHAGRMMRQFRALNLKAKETTA